MTAKVSKKNSFSTLSYQVLWLGSGIRPPRTIPLGPFIPVAVNKGLSLSVKTGHDAIVLTDKERIIQIGNNLLSNAVKFTEEGGVSLITEYDNGVLTLVVEDTGTGMTEEEQKQAFGAFERLSNAAAKEGFGLGLAIMRNIVSMLGGTIRLDSKKGKGSRFTVEISMQEAEEQLGYTSNTPVYHNNKFHDVVAIDNDEVLLLMLKEMYSQEGIHCDTCTDAAELMEMIRQKEYSLLLTDLNMPDIKVLSFCLTTSWSSIVCMFIFFQ